MKQGRDLTRGEAADNATLEKAVGLLLDCQTKMKALGDVTAPRTCCAVPVDLIAALEDHILEMRFTQECIRERAEMYDENEARLDSLNSERDELRGCA